MRGSAHHWNSMRSGAYLVIQWLAVHIIAIQCTAVRIIRIQCVAVCIIKIQYTTVRIIVIQCATVRIIINSMHSTAHHQNSMQGGAHHCNSIYYSVHQQIFTYNVIYYQNSKFHLICKNLMKNTNNYLDLIYNNIYICFINIKKKISQIKYKKKNSVELLVLDKYRLKTEFHNFTTFLFWLGWTFK